MKGGNFMEIFYSVRAFEKIADSIGVKVIEPPVEIGVIKGVSYTKSKNMQHNEMDKSFSKQLEQARNHAQKNISSNIKVETLALD